MIKEMHVIPDGAHVLVLVSGSLTDAEYGVLLKGLKAWHPNATFMVLDDGAEAHVRILG